MGIASAGLVAGWVSAAPPAVAARIANAFDLKSPAFGPGGAIPARFTCDGENLSPPLSWGDVPSGTQQLALVMRDTSVPRAFVHWALYAVPADVHEIAEGTVPQGGKQLRNDFRRAGYGGPCPPPKDAAHSYSFDLYALRKPLRLRRGSKFRQLRAAIARETIAQGTLVGTYQRS